MNTCDNKLWLEMGLCTVHLAGHWKNVNVDQGGLHGESNQGHPQFLQHGNANAWPMQLAPIFGYCLLFKTVT